MRAFSTALITAGLLLATPALQAATKHKVGRIASSLGTPACVFDTDRSAFDVEGLKSQLMVTAVTCKTSEKYNAFMSRYKPQVASAEQVLQTYFKRSYGKAGSKQYDEYMTQLADNQEQVGLKAGTAYCENLDVMYDEVMSLHAGSELQDYSKAKLLYQPVSFATCSGAPPVTGTSRARHSSKVKHT